MNIKKHFIYKVFIAIFTLLILIANVSFASYDNVTMEVVDEPICRIDISDKSYFEKRVINADLTNKNVTIQLKVVNGEEAIDPNVEIVFVIDNSESMKANNVGTQTRSQVIRESAKELISKLMSEITSLKIGAVSFSTDSDTSKWGQETDAKVVSELTTDSTALNSAIDGIEDNGPMTDLDAGLTKAATLFSEDADTTKYMVVLSDGIPNIALGYDGTPFSQDVVDKTIAKLKSTETAGINLITLLTGIGNGEANPMPGNPKTNSDFVNEIFGTQENPTAGTFFYVQDTEVAETITNDIYETLVPISKSLTNFKVKDYFPQEIIDNFDFAYVQDPNFGKISSSVDTTDNSITWNIPELKSGETAIVQYKLSLKRDYDPNIVGDILPTNKNIEFEYTDFDGNTQQKTSDVTPTLKLTEPLPVLPKAGTTIAIIAGLVIVGGAIFSLSKYLSIKNDLNH